MKKFYLRLFSMILCASLLIIVPLAEENEEVNISPDTSHISVETIPDELLQTANLDTSDIIKIDDTDKEDLSSIHYQKSDGTFEILSFNEPIKYLDKETNEIKFIDNTITEKTNISRSISGIAYENKTNAMNTDFSTNAKDGIIVEKDDFKITMKPLIEQDSKATKKQIELFGKDQWVVEYKDAFCPGTSLQYHPTNTGVKENIILEKYTEQNKFVFVFNSYYLVPEQEEGKYIDFVDPETREMVFTVNSAWAIDSFNLNEYNDDNYFKHFCDEIYYTVEKTGYGEYTFTMEISNEYLSDSETVYPVTIDPYVTHGYSDGGMPYTTVFSGKSETHPSRAYEYIYTGRRSDYGEAIGYLQFSDLSKFVALNPDNITRATVYVKQTNSISGGLDVGLYDSKTGVHVNDATYSAINYNMGTLLDKTYCQAKGEVGWWLTGVFKSWLSYERNGSGWGSYHAILRGINPSSSSLLAFYCSNNSLYLKVEYNNPAMLSNSGYVSALWTASCEGVVLSFGKKVFRLIRAEGYYNNDGSFYLSEITSFGYVDDEKRSAIDVEYNIQYDYEIDYIKCNGVEYKKYADNNVLVSPDWRWANRVAYPQTVIHEFQSFETSTHATAYSPALTITFSKRYTGISITSF